MLGGLLVLGLLFLAAMHRLVRPSFPRSTGPDESRAYSSYTAELVALQAQGAPFPKGKGVQEEMYKAFLRDVSRDATRNAAIPSRLSSHGMRLAAFNVPTPPRLPRGLRVMSFNVHFWQQGYSNRLRGANQKACVELVRRHAPDVLLLQEVVPTGPSEGTHDALAELESQGYTHRLLVPAPEARALPPPARLPRAATARATARAPPRPRRRCTRCRARPRTAPRRDGGCRPPFSAAARCFMRAA